MQFVEQPLALLVLLKILPFENPLTSFFCTNTSNLTIVLFLIPNVPVGCNILGKFQVTREWERERLILHSDRNYIMPIAHSGSGASCSLNLIGTRLHKMIGHYDKDLNWRQKKNIFFQEYPSFPSVFFSYRLSSLFLFYCSLAKQNPDLDGPFHICLNHFFSVSSKYINFQTQFFFLDHIRFVCSHSNHPSVWFIWLFSGYFWPVYRKLGSKARSTNFAPTSNSRSIHSCLFCPFFQFADIVYTRC